MKPIKYLFFLIFAMVGLISCDTYGDYEQEFSPVYPLSGQYYVKVIDEAGKEIVMHTITDSDGQKTDVFGTYMYLYIRQITIKTNYGSSYQVMSYSVPAY